MPGSITIDRFSITALAAGDHPAPDRIRAKLDAVNGDTLSAAIARRLGTSPSEADERLVLLRRVDLGLTEGGTADAATLADLLAGLLAMAIARLSAAPAEHVVVFPTRAAFLAAFVRAVARGEAWDRWWFKRFDGLKFLPTSAALRTALADDPEQGLAALAALAEGDRMEVLRALEPSDARRLLDACPADGSPALAAALVVVATVMPPQPQRSGAHASLALVAGAVAAGSSVPVGTLVRAAELLSQLQALEPEVAKAVAALLAEGRISGLPGVLAFSDVARLAPLFAAPTGVRRALAARLASAPAETLTRRFTRFGGLILLAQHLPRACAALPALLALAACAGPANVLEAIADPVLRDLLCLPPVVEAGELEAWLDELDPRAVEALADGGIAPSRADGRWLATPAALRDRPRVRGAVQALANAALRDLAIRLPGFSQASAPFLWRNLLNVGATITPTGEGLRATLERPPLDVLLAMSGLADRTMVLADGRALQLERAA